MLCQRGLFCGPYTFFAWLFRSRTLFEHTPPCFSPTNQFPGPSCFPNIHCLSSLKFSTNRLYFFQFANIFSSQCGKRSGSMQLCRQESQTRTSNCSPGLRTKPRPSSPRRTRAWRRRGVPRAVVYHPLLEHLSQLAFLVGRLPPLALLQPEHLR